MTETKSNNGLKVIAGLLGIVLLGTIIYTISLYKDKQNTTTLLTEEKELVIEDLNSLKSEYDEVILENDETNEKLVSARDRIAKYIDSIQRMRADITSLSRYRKQLRILNKERTQLLRQVDSLKKSNTLISMQRDNTYVELEKQTVFNDSLVVQNTLLSAVVEKGSELNLSAFSVDAVKERKNGKLVSKSKANRTDKFKICFTVAKNIIAETGNRTFFIKILDPQKNVLGEGSSKTNASATSITYSKTTVFYYENKDLDVCDYIDKPANNFQKGNYIVNVYDDKLKLLGKSEFTLK